MGFISFLVFQSRDFRGELKRAEPDSEPDSTRRFCGRRFVGLSAFLVFLGDHRRFLDAITFAGDGDDFGMVQEPVEDGAGGENIAEQFASFFQRAVAGHRGILAPLPGPDRRPP